MLLLQQALNADRIMCVVKICQKLYAVARHVLMYCVCSSPFAIAGLPI